MQEGWSADSEKLFAELGRCEHLFLYVIGAAGTSDDGQSVPAATSTHPKNGKWRQTVDAAERRSEGDERTSTGRVGRDEQADGSETKVVVR